MPELPEVEFARRSLLKWTDGRAIVRTEADPKARTFRGAKIADVEALAGRVTAIDRKGKFLMIAFDDGKGAVAHLGMTGKFLKRPAGADAKWSRARFVLDSGEVIHFQDPRLFGRIEPTSAETLRQNPSVAKLGVDPLVDGLTVEQLKDALGTSKQALKVALMDQERIAGLGNIHAAEALFRARLHPERAPSSLTDDEWSRLAKAIHDGIAFALEIEAGDEIEYVEEPGAKNPFLVYGKAGEPCPVCGTTIDSSEHGGRVTFFCPSCQPRGASHVPAKKAKKKVAKKATSKAAPKRRTAGRSTRKKPPARGKKRA